MNDLENKKALEALKAKASQLRAEREKKAAFDRKIMHMRFDGVKKSAAADNLLDALESSEVKHIRDVDNRPAEKLVKNRTRGMKKQGPSGGFSM